jgi:hypothetical protein
MGARVPRGAIPLSLTILAAALLWFGLFIAGPWFLRNPPGPNNPSFAWYAAFHFFPFALFGAVALLFRLAWTHWKQGK